MTPKIHGLNFANIPENFSEHKTRKNGIRKLSDFFTKKFFVNLKNKSRGVEPGFSGQKPWTENDDDKLFNPANPHHKKYRNKAEALVKKKTQRSQIQLCKGCSLYFGSQQSTKFKD